MQNRNKKTEQDAAPNRQFFEPMKRSMRKKRASRATTQTTETLADQAESQRQAGRYREALDSYKQLLKREPRPEWREALAEVYLGRAEQLAAKRMHKEAAALWENMAGACGERKRERYIDWLLRAGRLGRGARMFTEAQADFRDSPTGQRIATRLAVLLVCGQDDDIAAALPADSPLIRQRDAVLAAMQAYCRGDDAAMQASLKTVPFRSPYRELRLLLQGLATLTTDPQTALVQLARIDADSPLARFTELVRIAALDGIELLDAVAGLSTAERSLVLTLKGWNQGRIELAQRLPEPRQTSPRTLFQFALRSADQVEASRVRRFCLALLPHYPEGLPAFEKHFGSLPKAERERIHALAAEARDDLEDASNHWRACIKSLLPPRIDCDDALETALILRHTAELSRRLEGSNPWNPELWDDLVRSLELDPDDKPTYLHLMELARQRDDRKAQDHWTEQAVRRFPEDAEVLMAAGMAAYRRQSFKKAARFAGTLLERDPINPHARNLLISCHLAHARKQIKAAKHELAERELSEAATHARDEDQRGIVALNRGFLALSQGLEPATTDLLERGLKLLGGGLLARFRYLVDGRRLGISPQNLGRYYNRLQGAPPPASKQDILQLAELLHRYVDDGVKKLPKALDDLGKPLRAATRLEFSEQELGAVCAAFHKARHHGLLRHYAEAALQRFGHQPRFFYYYVFGRTKGRRDRLTPIERMQLEYVLDSAAGTHDPHIVHLIEDLLGIPAFPPLDLPPLPPELVDDLEQAMEALMDRLNTDDPEEVLDFIEEQLRKEGDLPFFPRPKGRRG